uniref:putative LAGLIDADG homing endonuclease n=1 Tax=Kalinella pachyderma TaxID=2704665 RepID=UPI0024111888|nr:putative LAGLIDADG homing endonuclease [Kalinella pachyderma]WDY12898.1 putative LAGLIDADG homing endonuclease [Kalinella pachyderma]
MCKDKNQIVKIKSSETTREALLTRFCFKEYINLSPPEHSANVDTTFLEWLIGFFEAEGSFLTWIYKRRRFAIEVSQKDGPLIHKIRSELGFGRVTEIKRKSEMYWRYYAQDVVSLTRLISLFNGNLITEKKLDQFKDWLSKYNTSKNKEILFLPKRVEISLRDAWLSGFLEGDAGFFIKPHDIIRFTKKKNEPKYDLKMKFYLTQKNELTLLTRIKELFQIPTKTHVVTNGYTKEKYNRIETFRLNCHLLVVNYLTRYPFRGKRSVPFSNWKSVLQYRTSNYPITDEAIAKLKLLIEKTKSGLLSEPNAETT